jgi:uncharacterized protein YegP (UPF0339 family)
MAKTKFEVYKDKKSEYRWRLLSQNGEPVATGSEGYSEKRGAMNAVKKLKDWASTDNIVDIEKAAEEAKKMKEKLAAAKKVAPKGKTVSKTTKKVATKAVKKAVKKTVKKVTSQDSPAMADMSDVEM